jgi:hypothetical protein
MKTKPAVKKVVISKIEITKSTKVEAKPNVDGRSLSLQQYHSDINEVGKKITKFAISLSTGNLLSVKMALMQAVQEVERKIQENKKEGG